MDLNNLNIIGRLTKDPASKTLQNGTKIAEFSIASNGIKEEVLFLDCSAFGKTAELACQYLKKGSQVALSGRLKMESWEKQGVRDSKIKLIINSMYFIGSRKEENSSQPAMQEHDYSNDMPF